MSAAHRLLGFAFAAADLLVEVATNGTIAFAMGAGEVLLGVADTALTGRTLADLIDPSDRPMVKALSKA